MPVLARPPVQTDQPEQLEGIATWTDAAGAAFDETFNTGPLKSISTAAKLNESEGGIFSWGNDGILTGRRPLSPKIPIQDAIQQVKDAGLEGKVPLGYPQGIRQETLNTLIELNRQKIRRQSIASQYDGWTPAVAGMVFGSIVDPGNIALAVIPVVGEARYAQLLSRTSSAFGRFGVRAGVGATEGVVGATLAEPFIYMGQQSWNNDYDAYDSMLNIAGGSLFGATLHAGAGLASDSASGVRRYFGDEQASTAIDVPVDAMRSPQQLIPDEIPLNAAPLTPDERAVEGRAAAQVLADKPAAIKAYESLEGTDGGRIISVDEAREIFPDYNRGPEGRTANSVAVHEPASVVAKAVWKQRLAEPVAEGRTPQVIFTAGGTGAGKTSAIRHVEGARAQFDAADLIYDGNLQNVKSAEARINEALDSGRGVSIWYINRDPVDAFTNGVLPRAGNESYGRTVPIEGHVATHLQAARALQELAERYKDNPDVDIRVFNNAAETVEGTVGDVARIAQMQDNVLRGELLNAVTEQIKSGKLGPRVAAYYLADARRSAGIQSQAAGFLRPEGKQRPSGGAGGSEHPGLPSWPVKPRTGAEAGSIIDSRLSDLEQLASQRLDAAIVKALDVEDSRLTAKLAAHEKRVKNNVIPADPRGALTDAQILADSTRRVEIRQQLEAHKAALAYGKELETLQAKLAKIDSDRALVELSEKLSPSVADPFANIRTLVAELDQATQAMSLRMALGQALQGQHIDVTPAVFSDPAFRASPEAYAAGHQNAVANSKTVEGADLEASKAADERLSAGTDATLDDARTLLKEDEDRFRDRGGDPSTIEVDDLEAKQQAQAAKAVSLCMMRHQG